MVEGIVKEAEVKSCTIQYFEVQVYKVSNTSYILANTPQLFSAVEVTIKELPFSIDDASRPESDFERVRPLPLSPFDPAHTRRWKPKTFSLYV
jgi:hypothetical protein